MLAMGLALPAMAVEPPDAWGDTAERQQLYRALSVRHPEPDCAAVEALVPDAVDSLTALANEVQMPPWAPMRAARCLVERHAEAAEPTLKAWVADPDLLGFAKLVTKKIDHMPEPVAVRVAEAALASPNAEQVTRELSASTHPKVLALVPK